MFFPCYFEDTAAKYLSIFNRLKIYDLINTPTIESLPDAWYKEFARCFFGSVDLEKRERLIQEFFVLIPKKNAKSTISGLIMLTALIANPYKGAEFALIASSKEVIDNCFLPIAEAINLDDKLKSFLKYTSNKEYKQVEHIGTGAKLKIITPLLSTNQGKKWQGVLFDEIAICQNTKNIVSIINELTGNLVNKKDAFIIYLTTQSHEPPNGVFKAILEKARRINKGGEDAILANKFLPTLYEFSKKEIENGAFRLPENWAKVNPNLGVSVSLGRLQQMRADAEAAGSEALAEFYAKYLNIEITAANSPQAWSGARYIAQCEKSITLKSVIDKSNLLYIGIDGGGLDDLTGVAVLGIDGGGHWRCWVKGYCYSSVLNRAGLAEKLRSFEKKGEVFIAEKLGKDSEKLTADIVQILSSGKPCRIGIDPRGIGEILINLKNAIKNLPAIEFINQGAALQNAAAILERRLAEKKITICRSDLLKFCANNAVITDGGSGEFLSKRTSPAKIDCLMALLNCVALFERFGNSEPLQANGGSGLANAINLINALKKGY